MLEIENFKERYLALKAKNKSDAWIAQQWFVSHTVITRLKKKNGLMGYTHVKPYELTQDQKKEFEGIDLTKENTWHQIKEIAERNGVYHELFRARLRKGWTVERAATQKHCFIKGIKNENE